MIVLMNFTPFVVEKLSLRPKFTVLSQLASVLQRVNLLAFYFSGIVASLSYDAFVNQRVCVV